MRRKRKPKYERCWMFCDDLNACAAIVEKADPDRFMAVMAAPVAARAALFPLLAFNAEVARAPWVTQEPLIAEMRLQWWRDALEKAVSGGGAEHHEVMSPLAKVLDEAGVGLLDAVVEARRWDIQSEPFADEAAFSQHIEATSGNLFWVGARAVSGGVSGAGSVSDETVVRDAAYAAGLANWFRAIPELEARGRLPLPDGRSETVRKLAVEGLERLNRARRNRAKARPAAPVLLMAWQAEGILRQVVADPRRVASGALGLSEFQKKGSLLLRSITGRW